MRRWMAGVLIAMMTMTSTAPIARAQSAPLIGGGLTALPKVNMGANLAQNPGFETLGPTGWTAGSGWSQDQLTKRSGTFSYRRDTGAATSSQNIQLKAGTYTVSGWVKTQSLGGNNTGVRLTFDQRPGGVFSWTPSDLITGTNDWTQITLGPIVLAADQAVAIMLENYNNPSGTAWFDDVVVQQMQPAAADVFMLYPNFRGMLFDDQPQTSSRRPPPPMSWPRWMGPRCRRAAATSRPSRSSTCRATAPSMTIRRIASRRCRRRRARR